MKVDKHLEQIFTLHKLGMASLLILFAIGFFIILKVKNDK